MCEDRSDKICMSKHDKKDKPIIDFSVYKDKKIRESDRRMMTALPGLFIDKETENKIFAQIINVSENGMGIQCQVPLKPKQKIILLTVDRDFEFEVIWRNPREHETHEFSIGINLLEDIDLCEYFCNLQHIKAG